MQALIIEYLLQVTYKQPDGIKLIVVFALLSFILFIFLYFGYYKFRLLIKGQIGIEIKTDLKHQKINIKTYNNQRKPLTIKGLQIIKQSNGKEQKFAPKHLDQLTLLGGTSHLVVLPFSSIASTNEGKFILYALLFQGDGLKPVKSKKISVELNSKKGKQKG